MLVRKAARIVAQEANCLQCRYVPLSPTLEREDHQTPKDVCFGSKAATGAY
jgi:hypothetical protein